MRPPITGSHASRRSYAPSFKAASMKPRRSGVEHERALQRVVALQIDIDAERRLLGDVARRFSDVDRRAGHGGEDRIGQRRVDAGRALIGLELGVLIVAYLDGA